MNRRNTMKSLYNKSGILPALFMNSRVDCGIAWSEHRRVEPVKREDVIHVESPPFSGHITNLLDEIVYGVKRNNYEHLSYQDRIKTENTPNLKPIDPKTIQVGDTVRLVGDKYKIRPWAVHFTAGKDYIVVEVDPKNIYGMPVKVVSDEGGILWLYGEDLVLVESA